MKAFWAFLVCMMLAACAKPQPAAPTYSYQPPPPRVQSREETKAKADAWVDCAWDAAAELDDGRSDAATVADSVRVACRKHSILNESDDKAYAINVVLRHRSSAKARPKQTDAQIKAAAEEWVDCVFGGVHHEDDGRSPPSVIADRIRPICTRLYNGIPSEERRLVIMAVEKVRANGSQGGAPVVSAPKKLPPGDLRF
jgi:hypothetical protein